MKGDQVLLGIAAVMIVVCVAFAAVNWDDSNKSVDKSVYGKITQSQIDDLQEQARNGASVKLTIQSSDGKKIVLDTEAVLSLNSAASLLMDRLSDSELTEADKAAVGDAPVYNISLGDNTNFGAGYATVYLPYELADGDDPDNVMVVCLDESSNIVGRYYGIYEKGFVSFKTGHFSKFAIIQGDVASEVANKFSYSGAFGNFTQVEKVSARLYSVKAQSGLSSDPYNVFYVYAGDDADSQFKDKKAQIEGLGEFMGVKPVSVYSDGLKQFALYKSDVDSFFTITMLYFVYNVGDVTVYAIASENGTSDIYSGIAKVDELATDGEIMGFVSSIMSAVDEQTRPFAIGSSMDKARYFIGNYSSDAYGKFTEKDMSDASSTATADCGTIKWEVRADALDQYKAHVKALDAMASKGQVEKKEYNGYDYVAAYSSEKDGVSSFYIVAYAHGVFIHSTELVNGKIDTSSALTSRAATASDMLNLSNFVTRSVGYQIYEGDAYTMLDAVQDFVANVQPSFPLGTWSYSQATTDDYSELRFDYSGRSGDRYNLITISKLDQSEYDRIAAELKALVGTKAVMTYNYGEFSQDVGATYYAVSYNGSTSSGIRFVMAVNGYMIDASGLVDRGTENTKYVYCSTSGTDEQNAMILVVLSNLNRFISKVGQADIEELDVPSMAARFATDYNDGKTTWVIKKGYTMDSAHLLGSYLNNSGKARYFDIFITNEPDAANKYTDLSEAVAALDGTTFLSSTTYSLYTADVDGLEYTAVSYSGNTMGAFRFVMKVGNVIVDASELSVQNDYPYIYIVSDKTTYDGVVASILRLMYNSVTSDKAVDIDAVTEKDEPGPEPPGPEPPGPEPVTHTGAALIADTFVDGWTRTDESMAVADGATAQSASIVETYTNSKGNQSTKTFTVSESTSEAYATAAQAVTALVGTTYMGATYVALDTSSITGVQVTAAVGQGSSSCFLNFVMFYNGYMFDASGTYVYLKGTDQSSAALQVVSLMATAMKSAIPAPEPTGAALIGDTFAGSWTRADESFALADGWTESSATLVETYTNSKGKQVTKSSVITAATADEYATAAQAITALVGTSAMGDNLYALIDTSSITGVQVTAVGSQLTSSYFLKFVMFYNGYMFSASTDYIYLTGADQSAAALQTIALMATAMKTAVPAPQPTGAALIGDTFAGSWTRADESFALADGWTESSATLVETYTNSKGKQVTKSSVITAATADEYATAAQAITALVGTSAMGDNLYALIDTSSITGVQVTAVGSQLTSSYFLKFVMFYNGYMFSASTDYIYLTGADQSAAALQTISGMASAFLQSVN